MENVGEKHKCIMCTAYTKDHGIRTKKTTTEKEPIHFPSMFLANKTTFMRTLVKLWMLLSVEWCSVYGALLSHYYAICLFIPIYSGLCFVSTTTSQCIHGHHALAIAV